MSLLERENPIGAWICSVNPHGLSFRSAAFPVNKMAGQPWSLSEKNIECPTAFLVIHHGRKMEAFSPGNMFSFQMYNARFIFKGPKKVNLKASEGNFCLELYQFLYRRTKFHRKFGKPWDRVGNAWVLVLDKLGLTSSFATYQLCDFTQIIQPLWVSICPTIKWWRYLLKSVLEKQKQTPRHREPINGCPLGAGLEDQAKKVKEPRSTDG